EVPEFSSYFSRYIQDLKAEWKAGSSMNNYDRLRFVTIECMGKVPDLGIVRELGELLDDMEWTVDPIKHLHSGADWSLTSPNGILAAQALAKLIESPPTQKSPGNYIESDVEDWRLWYARVKAGNQTFRFKGD